MLSGKKACLVVCLILLAGQITYVSAVVGQKEETLPLMSARNTLRINSVGSPALSPDGKWVLYTLSERDMEDNDLKRTTHIWRIAVDGTQARQMTWGKESCSSPLWTPDGSKLAFLSSRGEAPDKKEETGKQVFFMHADGGEAWQVTEHKSGINSFDISPGGERLLFLAADPLSEEQEKKKKIKDDAVEVDKEFRMTHLWVFDIKKREEKRLTSGAFTVSDPRWSPDGGKIAIVTRPNPKVDGSWNSDIHIVDAGTGEVRKLYENPGPDSGPRWSPDGKRIAFASHPYGGTSTWYRKLYLIASEGGEPRVLLKDFDRDLGDLIWAPDGKNIFWGTGDKTTSGLFSVDIETGQVDAHDPPRGSNSQWRLGKDGTRWIWIHSNPVQPGELYTMDHDRIKAVALTDANSWIRREKIRFGKAKTIRWKNSDGQWIEGVLTLPVDYREGKLYPLILNPHGGPSGARIEGFSASNQFFASNGFMVLQPNFRGSSNYGQDFLNSNRNQWGFRDYDDCMTGVDYCISEGWANPDKLICYGWSYGGYMSFWIATQTDRFKAVSPGAGLPDLYSMYSTTDIPGYLGWFFGTPWDNEDTYRKHSPIRYVKQVTSPILILHGGNDARVPYSQAVEFYQALRDLDKDVTFVRYPREGHGISEPRHQLDRMRRYLRFFTKHTGLEPVTEKEESSLEESKK